MADYPTLETKPLPTTLVDLGDYINGVPTPPASVAGFVPPPETGVLVRVDHHDLTLVRAAIAGFGGLYALLDLPKSARPQIGATWHESIGPIGVRGSWGRHQVLVNGYGRTGPLCATWGAGQRMTWGFWRNYTAAAWLPLTAERLHAAQLIHELDTARLLSDIVDPARYTNGES